MEDNYLDKQFKKILSNTPDFQASPEDLADMKMRLRQAKRRGGFAGWWRRIWWIPLLLFPLFISLFFLYQQTEKNQKTLHSLQEQLSQKSLLRIDTIYQVQTIVQIDTIVRRIYQTVYEPPSGSEVEMLAFLPNKNHRLSTFQEAFTIPSFKSSEIPGLINEIRLSQLTPSAEQAGSLSSLNKEKPNSSIPNSLLFPVSLLASNPSVLEGRAPLLRPYQTPYPITGGKSSVSPFRSLLPESASLGLGVMPLINPSHNYGGFAFGFGINAGLNFPKSWTLSIGLEALNMEFELKDAQQFSDFPIPTPEDPTDVLHELKPQLQYLQIPFLLQKKFYLSPGVRPFLGAGMVAMRPIKQKIKYEFIGGGQEYYTTLDYNTGDFSIANFRLLLGADLPLGSHWLIRPTLNYQRSLSEDSSQFFPLNYWAMDFSIHYQF